MFGFGGDPHFILAKCDTLDISPTARRYYMWFPQETTAPDNLHTHDPIGGGAISYNIWHSAMLRWVERPVDGASFSRFTVKPDADGSPMEVPDGTYQDDAAIANQTTYVNYGAIERSEVPRYLGVWQFLYSADKIEARRAMA